MRPLPRRLTLSLIYGFAVLTIGLPGLLTAFYGTSNVRSTQVGQDSALFSWNDAISNTTLAVLKGALFGGILGILAGIFIQVIALLAGAYASGWFLVTIFNWTFFAMIGGLLWGLRTGLSLNFKHGITMEFKYAVLYAITLALIGGGLGWAIWSLPFGLVYGSILGIIAFFCHSGIDILLHLCVRAVLAFSQQLPWRYNHFLDYATQRLLMRKVGDGYIFTHRLLMEHFAALTDDDITRITADLEDSA